MRKESIEQGQNDEVEQIEMKMLSSQELVQSRRWFSMVKKISR